MDTLEVESLQPDFDFDLEIAFFCCGRLRNGEQPQVGELIRWLTTEAHPSRREIEERVILGVELVLRLEEPYRCPHRKRVPFEGVRRDSARIRERPCILHRILSAVGSTVLPPKLAY